MLKNKNENKFRFLNDYLINGIAGLCGNLASGILYPLELVKLRLQVVEKKKSKMRDIISTIYNKEGLRGFFRGFYFSISSGGIANVMFFTSLEYFNQFFNNKGDFYSPRKQLAISYLCGLSTSILLLPMWTLKTRLSLVSIDHNESKSFLTRFRISMLIIKESILNEGIMKLYKGVLSSTILSFHGGIQMTMYETGKQYIKNSKHIDFISNYEGSLLGVSSKLTASTVLYPFTVIRTKQQQFARDNLNINETVLKKSIIANKRYGLIHHSIKTIYNTQGILGFYNGLTPSLIRQIPGSSLFFYTYEYTLKLLK